MASEERNALAELAERLDPRNYHRNDFLVAVESARRIISELAKVKDEDEYPMPYDYKRACRDAYENCRAIAEEGANE